MEAFASKDELESLWRKLKPEEEERTAKLLPVVSDSLRYEASKVGKNLDKMIADMPGFSSVVKSVTIDVTARMLMTSTNAEPMTQITQSALGYSTSGTYLVPGGGLFIKKSELARLGIRRQRYGVMEFYGNDQGNNCDSV